MAIQQDRAPYGTTGQITTVIEKHRQVGLPVMNLQRLQQIGISEALAPRTMHTLISLGFYDENGNVTPEFDALRKVPEHDFKPRLAAMLREAYAPILEVLDPATATPLDVENAFRGFEPTGQLPRMIQLFMGLMIYADLMPEDRRRAASGGGRPHGTRSATSVTGKRRDLAPAAAPGKPVRETQPEIPLGAVNGNAGHFSQTDGNVFVLKMPSGPEMTLAVKMDVMLTSVEDRNFIFKIVDELRAYAQASGGDKAAGTAHQDGEVSS